MRFNFLIYLLILAASALSAAALTSAIGYTPLYMILSLTIISVIYTLVCFFGVAYREKDIKTLYTRATSSRLSIDIYNKSLLFVPHVSLGLIYGDEKKTVDFPMLSHQARTIDEDIRFDHIGLYSIGIKYVKFYDLLGIFGIKRRHMPRAVAVAPRIVEAGDIRLKSENSSNSNTISDYSKLHEDEAYNGVREYVPGDSLKNIHWKLTAHTSKYMSRTFEVANKNGISVYIDLLSPECEKAIKLSLYDCIAEAALSAAMFGIRRGLDAELVISEKSEIESYPLSSAADVQNIAPMFSKLKFGEGCGAIDLIKHNIENNAGFDNIVVCTAKPGYELACYLGELKSLNINPVLIYAVPAEVDLSGMEDTLKYLADHDIECRIIVSADELAGGEGRRQTV